GEFHVLEVPDAVPGLAIGMAGNREPLFLTDGLRVVGRGVTARHGDLPLGEVAAGADAEPRLARVELRAALGLLLGRQGLPLRVEPEVAVASVEEHAVALADLGEALAVHHRLDVGGGDDARALGVLGDRQPLHAAVGGAVEEDAPADERLFGHVLDAEDAQAEDATARASLVGLFTPAPVAVEVALRGPHADVARAVELGADLADLGLDELVV